MHQFKKAHFRFLDVAIVGFERKLFQGGVRAFQGGVRAGLAACRAIERWRADSGSR